METIATKGEMVLSLMIYRALTPENCRLASTLVEAMKESQSKAADLKRT